MTREEANAFIAAVVKMRALVDDKTALEAHGLYPKWKVNIVYSVGDRVIYEDTLYKVLQQHTSQPDWNPADAHSLFAKVLIPDVDVIPDWEQPDSTNPYMIGDKVKHNGKTWSSYVDNNVWEPGIYGWTEI